MSSVTYFSNLLEDKDRRFKIKLTLSLILRVNLRLGGYSICSASLIAPHIKKTGAAKEVLGGHFQDEVRENSKDAFRSTRKPTVLGYEELGGLSDPGTWDCPRGTLLLRYGMGHASCPTSVVTTRNAVGLLVE
jgi:hypothetical protein